MKESTKEFELKKELIVLSALCHDVGKLFERGELFEDVIRDRYYLSVCPSSYSYLHSAYTLKFCEILKDRFWCLKDIPYNWHIWASAHHKSEENFEVKIIRWADVLSSREREEGEFYQGKIHKRTLLEPVIERVFLAKNQKLFTSYRYPLESAYPLKNNIFPIDSKELSKRSGVDFEDWGENAGSEVSEPGRWTHMLAKDPLNNEYARLGMGFLNEIEKLPYDLSLESLTVALLSLLEIYTSNIPSATNIRHPDISLFDHLRTTAAIAQALYIHQVNLGKRYLGEGLKDENEKRWLLVCGDFSGIQKFIYNLTNKGAAKGLKGRSFYVQLFCKVCAQFILKSLGLNPVALIYNSGGKFYLLIPSIMENELFEARKKINLWLLEEFGGDVFLGIGTCKVSAKMFNQGEMHRAWKRCAENLLEDRTQKFKENIDYNFFEPFKKFNPTKSCSVCGGRSGLDEGEDVCKRCRELQSLGKDLVRSDALLMVWRDHESVSKMLNLKSNISLKFSEELKCHVFLIKKDRIKDLDGKKVEGELALFLKEQDSEDDFMKLTDFSLPVCDLSFMYVAKWRKTKEDEEPYTFEDYAKESEGIKRLGILRMDVDNLGMVFEKGLMFPQRDRNGWGSVVLDDEGKPLRKPMASISRMATLSRQLNLFFSAYIEQVVREYECCEIIYSGGDDLFIIGAWDRLPDLAKRIHQEFKAFCCYNKDLSISGGLYLVHGKYPIYRGAFLTEESEKMAKSWRKNWKEYLEREKGIEISEFEKGAFCFVDSAVLWEDFEIAEKMKKFLAEESEKNKGLLNYLINISADNKNKVKRLMETEKIYDSLWKAWQSIKYDPWYWRLCYHLKRRYGDREEDKKKISKILNFIFNDYNNKALISVFSWMDFVVNWVKLKLKEEK